MKKLTTSLCLIFAVLFGSVGVSWSADFEKGLAAAQSGDFVTALREWTLLAEQGNAFAQFNLGLMYASGEGVPRDDVTAYMWYNIAASSGNKLASKRRDRVANRMSPAQLTKAEEDRKYNEC